MGNIQADKSDLFSGILFASIGLFTIYTSLGYAFGSAQRMGPGYFPAILGGLLTFFGLVLIARSFARAAKSVESLSLRPMLAVLGGALCFGLLVRPAGLLVAIVVMVLLGSLGDPKVRPLPAIVAAAVLAAGSTIVFVYLLGQPLPILGYWFG